MSMVGRKVQKAAGRCHKEEVKRIRAAEGIALAEIDAVSPITGPRTSANSVRSSESSGVEAIKRKDSSEGKCMVAKADAGTDCQSKTAQIVETHLLSLLHSRQYPKTICPSEVPRALSESEVTAMGRSDWRELMPLVRTMLFNMRSHGQVEILQKGNVIPPATTLKDIRGPIRARLIPSDEG